MFYGGQHKSGITWAQPRGKSDLYISVQHPYSNEHHLSFKAFLHDGYGSAGYNWASWKGEGVDITQYKNLVFQIGVSKTKIEAIYIQLASKGLNKHDEHGAKVDILPDIEKRNVYVRISIPIKKLLGRTLDPKHVWGFNIEVFGKGKNNAKKEFCRIFLDNIRFEK